MHNTTAENPVKPLYTCAAIVGKQISALLVCAITPVGFALHKLVCESSHDTTAKNPVKPLCTCAAPFSKLISALLVCAITPVGFALHTALL